MKKLLAIFIVVLMSSMILFAGGTSENDQKERVVRVMGAWVSSEAEAFEYVLKGFTEETGIKVEYEGATDWVAVISTRIAAGELPDLAVLGGADGYMSFLNQGVIKPLDFMKDDIEANYVDGWITPFTSNGKIYAFPIRCNVQNCMWYNPENVGDVDFSSYESFLSYLEKEKAAGKFPMAGLYKGYWTSSLIFNSCLSSVATFEEYGQFMTGHMRMDDPIVIKNMERLSYLINNFCAGGAAGALGTDLTEGFALVFGSNPTAQFINAGSWGSGIVTGGVNDKAVEGVNLTFELFPGYNAIETNTDPVVMFNDTEEARMLLEYLASTEGISRFTEYGYVLPNKNINTSLYEKYPLAQKAMEQLKDPIVVPTKVMDAEYADGFYKLIQGCIANPNAIVQLCKEFEATYGHLNTVID